MAYYLKKTKLKGRTYLSIDESFYSNEKKGTAHRCYKSLGSVETHIKNGMDDPVSHFQKMVDELNAEQKKEKGKLISESSPLKYLGYFPLKNVLDGLNVHGYFKLLQTQYHFQFDGFDMLSVLVYARCVKPCSKYATFHEVIPSLYGAYDFSYDQILEGCEYLGNEYEKVIEIFNHAVKKKYGINTDKTYFDCTNFYFEIDREDEFRRKGPSKENRHDPIVGLGLLLDKDLIPIGMKTYPGNQSEKPVLREVVSDLKERGDIQGRTIMVADKGLNCGENICSARKNGDGYLFSKAVKMLPETEKVWLFLDNGDWKDVKDKNGVVLYRYKSCVDQFLYEFTDEDGKKKKIRLTEKRVATYNPTLAEKQKREILKLVEKARCLSASKAKKDEYGECSKYVEFKSRNKGRVTEEKAACVINQEKIDKDLSLAGYNLLVTSETEMSSADIYNTYHNLWRIEETFRTMKSELDARPVFLQKEERIIGHFLVCYIAVLLVRLLQFKVLGNEFGTHEIMSFLREYNVVYVEGTKHINVTRAKPFIPAFAKRTGLPLMNYFLKTSQIKQFLNHKF